MHDPALRKRAQRRVRERGCWVYIPGEMLGRAGLAKRWPLFYRAWGGKRGRFVVVLYVEA